MSQVRDIIESMPPRAEPALYEIGQGMELKKCRKCGCMKDALNQAKRVFEASDEQKIRSLLPRISDYQARMEPLAYDCIGCKKCWGADATIELANQFDEVELDTCGSGDADAEDGIKSGVASLHKSASSSAIAAWPPHPGDYVLGSPEGTVAICTLSNRDLPARLIAAGEPALAIAGRCDTENIGIEKVVLNLLANPRIRWLVICGAEAKGHRAGQAFLRLKERGVDADMRVLESASWRPILRNLTLLDVARFRQQIEEVDLIGVTDLESILVVVRDCANKPVQALHTVAAEFACRSEPLGAISHILAKAPKQLRLDPAGFFIILPQPQKRLIVCEHYENSGRLAHVIEGRRAALIAAAVVDHGLVTQLDHSAYLGRELAKAESALSTGVAYEQDAALGRLATAQTWREPHKAQESDCRCSKATPCAH